MAPKKKAETAPEQEAPATTPEQTPEQQPAVTIEAEFVETVDLRAEVLTTLRDALRKQRRIHMFVRWSELLSALDTAVKQATAEKAEDGDNT